MHTGGPCDTLQTGSGKARQRPEETRKTCPVKVIQTTRRARLSLRAHPCVYPHVLLFPPNKHFTCFTTFCLCVEIHFCTADGPGAWSLARGPRWSGGLDSVLSLLQPDFSLQPEPKPCLSRCRLRPPEIAPAPISLRAAYTGGDQTRGHILPSTYPLQVEPSSLANFSLSIPQLTISPPCRADSTAFLFFNLR